MPPDQPTKRRASFSAALQRTPPPSQTPKKYTLILDTRRDLTWLKSSFGPANGLWVTATRHPGNCMGDLCSLSAAAIQLTCSLGTGPQGCRRCGVQQWAIGGTDWLQFRQAKRRRWRRGDGSALVQPGGRMMGRTVFDCDGCVCLEAPDESCRRILGEWRTRT
jgi:hypothetical protein